MTIEELISALEKADGPSRELDAEIDAALRIGSDTLPAWAWKNFANWRAKHKGTCEVMHDNGQGGLWWDSQPFTSSIDVALGLLARVLPGWHWYAGSCPPDFRTNKDKPFSAELIGPVTYAVVDRDVGEEPIYDTSNAMASSSPIALVLAIITALKAKQVQP
jgi:hypothetical protein